MESSKKIIVVCSVWSDVYSWNVHSVFSFGRWSAWTESRSDPVANDLSDVPWKRRCHKSDLLPPVLCGSSTGPLCIRSASVDGFPSLCVLGLVHAIPGVQNLVPLRSTQTRVRFCSEATVPPVVVCTPLGAGVILVFLCGFLSW